MEDTCGKPKKKIISRANATFFYQYEPMQHEMLTQIFFTTRVYIIYLFLNEKDFINILTRCCLLIIGLNVFLGPVR